MRSAFPDDVCHLIGVHDSEACDAACEALRDQRKTQPRPSPQHLQDHFGPDSMHGVACGWHFQQAQLSFQIAHACTADDGRLIVVCGGVMLLRATWLHPVSCQILLGFTWM